MAFSNADLAEIFNEQAELWWSKVTANPHDAHNRQTAEGFDRLVVSAGKGMSPALLRAYTELNGNAFPDDKQHAELLRRIGLEYWLPETAAEFVAECISKIGEAELRP